MNQSFARVADLVRFLAICVGVVTTLTWTVSIQAQDQADTNKPMTDFEATSDASQQAAAVEEFVPAGEPTEADGRAYTVTDFELMYTEAHAQHIPVEDLQQVPIMLGLTPDGYVAPRADVPTVVQTLDELAESQETTYYASAVQHIAATLVQRYNNTGIIGVYVGPSSEDIGASGENLRAASDETLTLVIRTGLIHGVRTVAVGDRFPGQARVNHAAHHRIREFSPVAPRVGAEEGTVEYDLINKDAIDQYVFRLNRHPGRRVDVAVAPAGDGGATLDYIVTESKPWTVYAQIANTGSESTDEWRQTFGFTHNQLTNNDDILRLNYTTTAFDELHGISASYERPFPEDDLLRWQIHGSYQTYDAAAPSLVPLVGEGVEGESWDIGGDFIYNFYQDRELFFDVVAGVRWYGAHTDNRTVGVDAQEVFFLPHFGLEMERVTKTEQTFVSLDFEFNLQFISRNDENQMQGLGRIDADETFAVLKWNFSHSFYLEPIFNREAWEDVSTPSSSTLAHELAVSFRGQYGFENRLIPQFQDAIGGFYSVRGYRQSVVSGDTSMVASAEYRFHLPRVLELQPDPSKTPLFGKPFRYAPQRPYGSADWDLILRTFFDVGYVHQNDIASSFEKNHTLAGAGVGVEFLYKRNLNVRVDWGFALNDVEPEGVSAGSSQVHILATLLY